MEYIKKSFIGGFNQQVDSTRLAENEYSLLINGRNRYDLIQPIKLPAEITDPMFTNGNVQELRAAGSILLIFMDGLCFWKNYNIPNSGFQKVPGLHMAADASLIFTELVPDSNTNNTRIPQAADNRFNTDVNLINSIPPSVAGIVVQDGVSQPQFIDANINARILNNYNAWTLDTSMEYVPIGKQMLWFDGNLYIVNGRFIYRSVTGKPLDFMVIVTNPDGDKLPTEAEGGAINVALTVDFDDITSINKLSTEDDSFFVSTNRASYAVTPDFTPEFLIFGEPVFNNRFLFSSGCISPYSFVDILGDSAFVDFNGLRSFNAVQQLKFEGQNSVFSQKIGPTLQGIVQDYTAAIVFDNYALFAVNTIYGRAIIVYDTLHQVFSAIDIYPGIGQIKKFEEVKTIFGRRLFFSTVDNKIYEAFAGKTSTCSVYVGDFTTDDPNKEQKARDLELVFINILEGGMINASIYTDKRLEHTLDDAFNDPAAILPFPVPPPFAPANTDTVKISNFNFASKTTIGWRLGAFISWDFNAALSHVKLSSNDDPNEQAVSSQARQFVKSKNFLNKHN